MDINSLQGSAAYANVPNTASPAGSAATQDQNIEASKANLDTETTSAVQKAFEVTITPEAQEKINQERLAAEATASQASERTDLNQPEPIESENVQNLPPDHGSSSILNIVA